MNSFQTSVAKMQTLATTLGQAPLTSGNKRQAAAVRKTLMEIKNLAGSMRAEALAVSKDAKPSKITVEDAEPPLAKPVLERQDAIVVEPEPEPKAKPKLRMPKKKRAPKTTTK
jgi:hypothetical protein